MTLRRSIVFLEDVVYVNIKGHRRVPGGDMPRFERAEDGLLGKWLQWLCDHPDVYSVGGDSSGLGSYSGTFPIMFRGQIEKFFQDEGARMTTR